MFRATTKAGSGCRCRSKRYCSVVVIRKKIRAWTELVRLQNVGIAAFTGLAGFWLIAPVFDLHIIIFGVLAIALFCLGGNVVNDLFDIEIDRVNRPERPLVSGRISQRAALVTVIIAFLVGLGISYRLGFMPFALGMAVVALLVGYAVRLKRILFVGNITVAFITALTFPYVGSIYKIPLNAEVIFPALFIFLFHLGREIIKDIVDIEGDSRVGARTIPIVFGRGKAVVCAAIPFIVLVPLTFVPYFLKVYGIYYLLLVTVLVDTMLLLVIVQLFLSPSDRKLNGISTRLKLTMALGVIALALGHL